VSFPTPIPLYAATPYTPSARAAGMVGLRRFKTRSLETWCLPRPPIAHYPGEMVAVQTVNRPPRWPDQVGGATSAQRHKGGVVCHRQTRRTAAELK
jgi:hypothetical protein